MTDKNKKDMMKEFLDFLTQWMFSRSTDLNQFDLNGSPFSNIQDLFGSPQDSFFYAKQEMFTPDWKRIVKEWGSPLNSLNDQASKENKKPGVVSEQDTQFYTDIISEEENYKILIDMRGQNPETVEFEITEETITAKQEGKKLSKILLPSAIKPAILKKEIHNGIITIEVEKKKG